MTEIQNKLKSEFERLFDRIYVIHLLDYDNRLKDLKDELERVGLLYSNKLEWYYDVKSPLDASMYEHLTNPFNKPLGVRKLSYNHYKLVKIAKTLKYDRILIIEDDLRFLKDLEKVYEIIHTYPENADICMLDKVINEDFDRCPKSFTEAMRLHLKDYSYYYVGNYNFMASSACYGLTLAGMDYLVNQIEALYASPGHVVVKISEEAQTDIMFNFMNSDHFINTGGDYDCSSPDELTEYIQTYTFLYKPENPVTFAYSLYNIGVQLSAIDMHNDLCIYVGYKFLDLSLYNIDIHAFIDGISYYQNNLAHS